MARFKVTFLKSLDAKPPIEVFADDVVGISDYTVQFVDTDGRTLRVLGGISEVERLPEKELATIDTTGKPAVMPESKPGSWPCQVNEPPVPAKGDL